MRSNRRRDTRPELALRSAVHALGLRYRVCAPALSGIRRSADLLFTRARVAVFLDGCFWHSCPEHGSVPRANRAYWEPKLLANRRRDEDTDARLRVAGWTVVRVWEHEDAQTAAERIAALVRPPKDPGTSSQSPESAR